ncbi:unnamed protein product [Linum tenue]|uniref:EF-hand domain-containing protein n=1 Tax=Linum tenue TaxID=586396 RepID=A0AAV0JAM7_9ROSI|nr:unnamed protein product [Linum tenue]
MVERLGAEGFMDELHNGFRLLMDPEKEMITAESLKRNAAAALGLMGETTITDEEARCMVREGDLDGDGGLSQLEFFSLMFRLSPDLMSASTELFFTAVAAAADEDDDGRRGVFHDRHMNTSKVKYN